MKAYMKPAIEIEMMEMEQAFLGDSAYEKRNYSGADKELGENEEFD